MATRDEKYSIGAKYFYGKETAGALTGVQQQDYMPKIVGGGQLGVGYNPLMLDVATPCVLYPTVLVVTSLPAMYVENGQPTTMGYAIKELIECFPKQVSGIDFGYSQTPVETQVGHDGQSMRAPGKTKRTEVNPSFTFQEIGGSIIYNCFKRWLWDMNHPDTNVSMNHVKNPGIFTMSAYSMSMMAIQFDPTQRPDRILGAAFYSSMFPVQIGNFGYKRNISTADSPERQIEFVAMVHENPYIKSVAIAIAEELALHSHNFNLTPPHKSNVDAPISGLGQQGEIIRMEGEYLSDPRINVAAHPDFPDNDQTPVAPEA